MFGLTDSAPWRLSGESQVGGKSIDFVIVLEIVARTRQLFGFKRREHGISLLIGEQDLDPALGLVEPFAALAREFHAGFEKFEAFFERKITVLKLTDDLLKFGERCFE